MELTAITVLLSVVVAFGEASRELVIVPGDESFTRPLGASMVLTCKVVTSDGQRPPAGSRLRWLDGSNQEIVNINGRRYVEVGDYFKKLYIVDIVRTDAGEYKCLLDASVQLEKSTTLIIYQQITFDRAPGNQYLRRHAPGVIQCVVSGQPLPIVSWRFRGSRITTGGRYVVREGGLEILNVTDSDAGNYTCRAEVDEFGNYAEQFISVDVNIPPVFTQSLGSKDAVQGEEFYFQCEATATPLPSYQFYKDGERLQSGNRIVINTATGVVWFRTVIKSDEGTYRCVASNNVGNVSATGLVKVLVKATVREFSDVTGREGEASTLRCRAIGDPAPQITIRKGNETDPYQLTSSERERVFLRNVSGGVLELVITSLNAADASNYSCSAMNSVGHSQRTAVLTVNYSPRFAADHSREAFTWAGVSRNISCFPLAEPPATVEWTRFGQTIVNNGTYKIFSTTTASNLQVYVREIDQAWIYGVYTCRASNDFGTREINIALHRASVPDAPRSVELTETRPDGVVLTVEPPDEDGGMPVIGYRVHYGDAVTHDVTSSEGRVVVRNLQPGTTYLLRITAKNEVGFGNYEQLRVTTKSLSNPYAVVINSFPVAKSSSIYRVEWEMISSGGLPIIEYEFKYIRVRRNGTKLVPLDATWKYVRTSPPAPINYFELQRLQPETNYQLAMRVRNQLGWSNFSSDDFVFHTLDAKFDASVKNGGQLTSDRCIYIKVLLITVISVLFRHAAFTLQLCY